MSSIQFSVVTNINSNNVPRLGTLINSGSQIDTPAFMFYTKVSGHYRFNEIVITILQLYSLKTNLYFAI